MLPLAAYADRLSVRPGETVRFHVSNRTGEPVAASVARVVCGDANPAGPGIVTEPVAAPVTMLLEPGAHDVPSGSYAAVDGIARAFGERGFSFACRVLPTRIGHGEQAIAAWTDAAAARGFTLAIDDDGRLDAGIGSGRGFAGAGTDAPMREGRWHVVWLAFDAAGGRLRVGHARLQPDAGFAPSPSMAETTIESAAWNAGDSAPLLMAAREGGAPCMHFDGKLEAPTLWDRALGDDEIDTLAAGGDVAGAAVAFDFSRECATSRIVDTGPHRLDGRLVNTPARAMTGSRWDGREMCFHRMPEHYGAIGFHGDDLDDCRWPAACEWTVPEGTRSGVYALYLAAGEAGDNVPFHVVPPKGEAHAAVAVLASTFTYAVYGNHMRPEFEMVDGWAEGWREQSRDWGAYPHNPGDHPEYGRSTYNRHADGSGISIVSWLRPMLNVRVGYITYPFPDIRASGLRHLPADTHLYCWLERNGIDYDLITDQELLDDGVELLARYRCVLTGSHPEYHTRSMLDALEAYRDGGGRLCYLGGNGFYWKIALSPEKDGVIEIRRGEGGIRAWAAEPGEYYNQFDGEYGGLWRRNGRPPQHLCGVGFTAQGNYSGSHYRLRPEARESRAAWIFDGVDGETIGGHGLSAHGAAGFELDRADKRLGTPVHALVLASSEDHPPDAPWVLVPEEMLTHLTTWPGPPAKDLIHADIVFFECANGGAVFSTGSITFCGSLLTNGGDNDVSTMMLNVVRRFADPAPFEMPPEA